MGIVIKSDPNFRALVEQSPDVIVYFDSDLRCSYVNPVMERLTGLPPEAFLGMRLEESPIPATPAERAERQQRLERVFATGQAEVFQVVIKSPLGERAFDVRYTPTVAEAGHVTGVFSVARDITAQWQAEMALRRSEESVRQQLIDEIETIYASAPVGLCVLDQQLRYLRINDELAALNGLPVVAHLGRTPREILRSELADTIEPLLREVLVSGEPVKDIEYLLSLPNSPAAVRSWLMSCYPLKDTLGQVIGINIVVTETSKLKQAELALQRINVILEAQVRIRTVELQAANSALRTRIAEHEDTELALQASEVRYQALAEAIPVIILRVRRDGTVLYAKGPPDFATMIPMEQTIGKNYQEIVPAALAAQTQQVIDQALAIGAVQTFEYEVTVSQAIQSRTSTIIPINHEDVLVLTQDITARKEAEIALRQSEERYRTLVQLMPDALIINQKNRLVYANPALLRLLGATSLEQVLGKIAFDFVHPDYRELIRARMQRVLVEEGGQSLTEAKLIRLDGTFIDVESAASRYQDQAGVGVQVILRDITQRKEAEAQRERLLEQLAAQHQQMQSLNHRLATAQEDSYKMLARELHDQVGQNLTALTLSLTVLQNRFASTFPGEAQLWGGFADALALVGQITRDVRQLLSELRPPTFDELGLFATLRWFAEDLARRVNLQIHVSGEEPIPKLAEPVALALFRITQEALTNVIKHAQATQVDIQLWADEMQIHLLIADNGRGFARPPFDNRDQHLHWGLLNMRERAAVVGGQIRIESNPGQGTLVQVDIPRQQKLMGTSRPRRK